MSQQRRMLRIATLILLAGVIGTWLGCRTTQEVQSSRPAVSSEASWNLEGEPPYLAAHYMPWFEIDPVPADRQKPNKPIATRLPSSWFEEDAEMTESGPTWRHWKWDRIGPLRNPDDRWQDGRRKIASVYYPLIGPYNSRSRTVMRYHLETAKAAGIQVFFVIWYGPGSFEDAQLPALLDEAARAGMRIAICYEEKINFHGYRPLNSRDEVVEHVVEDLETIAKKYGPHPAYLKRNGLPFIFQFNGWGKGELGPNVLTPAEWRDVFGRLDQPIFYARQNLDEEYHPPTPGAYVWWSTDAAWLRSVARRAGELRQNGRLFLFMSMVCPGFDDTGVWGWGNGPRKEERHGLSTLKNTVDIALESNPEFVQIVTWNDFAEGTVVEPTRENGFQYLDALETWWGQKTGRAIDLSDNRKPFLEFTARASESERAELPEPPYDELLAERSLEIERPDALRNMR